MDRRRRLDGPGARLARFAGVSLIGVGFMAAGLFVLLPLMGTAFVQAIQLMVAACVWLATSIGVGLSFWDVLGTIGRAAAGGLATPTASIVLGVLVLVGIVALYWLQRLIESEEESSQ
jgi:hypothetical protein